ncbi:MAG: sugar phosphate isomerase/epimerase [Clostridia bacterium]|nr:sugar phosphate isomerase/epimerase [Clostridia bacterium]
MKKRISTEIGSAANLVGARKAVEYCGKAGFDAWDFSMFDVIKADWSTGTVVGVPVADHPLNGREYLAYARELKHIGLESGIVCNQSHAPFPPSAKEFRDFLPRALEVTAEAGGQVCVIHPQNNLSPEGNRDMFLKILPYAKEYGVKIATENMWNWNAEEDCAASAACSDKASFLSHLNALDNPFFGACVDVGHGEMKGLNTSAAELIRGIGKDKLFALHIHDNDKWHDSHQIPFSMQIDFGEVMKALADIGYLGDLTLECDAYLRDKTKETAFLGLSEMASAANRLFSAGRDKQ